MSTQLQAQGLTQGRKHNCPGKLSASTLFLAATFLTNSWQAALSKPISFEQVQQQALANSFELASAAVDSKISKNRIRGAKVAYYPIINGSMNSEYIGGLANQNTLQSQQAVVVGNTILPGNTRFQNAISLNSNYTAVDFGARANQLKAAKHHAASSALIEKVLARDLSLQVLEAYIQALATYKELLAKQEQEELHAKLYEMKSRYWDAGKISRIELGEEAIAQKNCEKEVHELKQKFAQDLNALSALTHETYNVATTELDDLEQLPSKEAFRYVSASQLPDTKAFDHMIREKQAELQAIKAQRLPQVVTYSSFVLYGSNQTNWVNSIGNLSARQITGGVGVQLPIFDGGRNSVLVQDKKLEIEKLMLQRNKRLWDVRKDFEKNVNALALFPVELSTKAELVNHSKDKLTMTIRLTQNHVEEKTKAISEQIDLLNRQLDEEKARLQKSAAAMRVKIYAETQEI